MALDFEKVDLGGFGINEDDTSLNATMSEAVKVNPDQQAHINKLSQESGVPTFAVESDPAPVESKLNFDNLDLSGMSKRSPNTAEYLVDFNNAAIAHDDTTALEAIESVFDFSKTFENIGESITTGFEQQATGLVATGIDFAPTRIEDLVPMSALPMGMEQEASVISQQFASNLGIDTDDELQTAKIEATEQMLTTLRDLKSVKEKLQPEDLNLLEQGVRAGVESLANMAPGFGLMLATGGRAAPLLATMGVQTFGGSYADARADGLDPQKASWFAGIDAAIEVGTEVLPVGQLENIITGGTKGLGKKALKFMIKEMGTEQLATLGQTINSYVFGLDEQMEKATTVAEMAQIQLQRQAVTAIATVVAGGAMATAATGVNKTINSMSSEESKKKQAYAVEQQSIDRLNEKSNESKLKTRDKESFKQFVEKSDGENNTHVFIDASQVNLYLKTKTREEINNDPVLTMLNDQMGEASTLDGEVQIPVADFASEMTGTEHFDALRDSMTMSDQTVSPFRQTQEQQETASYVRNLMTEAQESASEYVEAQDIYTSVRQQLIDSGRVTPQNATIMAQVVPAWATAQAKRSGKSVQQVYQDSGLIIEGPLTGEQQRLQDELSVFTQDMTYDETGQIQRDENFNNWFGDSKVVDESGQPLVVYHGTDQDFEEFSLDKVGDNFGLDKVGFFFTTDRDSANRSRKSYPDKSKYAFTEDDKIAADSGKIIESFVSINNPVNLSEIEGFDYNNSLTSTNIFDQNRDVIIKAVEDQGADGVIIKSQGETLVVPIEPTQIKSVNNRGTFDPADPNILNQDQVEPKNLIVTHNISEAGLKKAIELGGLAAPSLAVVNTDVQELSGFGEITLIPKPEILNEPKVWTFDADIYSARQPRAEDVFDNKKIRELKREIEEANEETGLISNEIHSVRDLENRAVFYMYLKSVGKAPKIKKVKMSPIARAVKDEQLHGLMENPKFIKAVADDLKKQLGEFDATNEAEKQLVEEITMDWFTLKPPEDYELGKHEGREGVLGWAYSKDGEVVTPPAASKIAAKNRLNLYLRQEGIDQEFDFDKPRHNQLTEAYKKVRNSREGIDSDALRDDLIKKDRNKKLREGFTEWYTEKYESLVKNRRLRKGYQKYQPYTLDNVVREMTRTLQGGESGNYGAASIRAVYAKHLKNKKQVQARRDSFTTKEEMSKIKDESNEKFFELTEDLKSNYKYDTESWGYGTALAEAITDQDFSVFKDRTEARRVVDKFGEYLAGLPTEYFETKVQRAMDFSEFETALVPKGTKKEIVDSLRNFGLKVKRYDAESETGRLDALKKEQNLLFQPTSPDVPGTRGYYSPEDSLIRLTESSDLSTFLHEFAHFMYEMELAGDTEMVQSINSWYRRNSKDVAKEANRYAKKEFDSEKQEGGETAYNISHIEVETYLDTGTSGNEAKDSAIRRAVHEQFARGFETYLMEGKAPSIELRNAFRTFARWLSQVYQSLKGDLNVNLDAEMRQVFDRLLATEEQIAAAEARARFEPMFTDAAMAGMTEEEFTKYQQQQEKVKDKQSETLRDKLIAQLTRQTKKWWKEEKQDITDVEIDNLKKERVYVAREQLKNGELKLDFATTKEMIGEQKTDKRGRTTVRVSPKLKGMTIKENQGFHPDEMAAFLGYNSGSEMLNDLITAPPITEVADTRAEAKMIERHGDIMTDGTIERAADDAVQNEERGKLILKELKALSKGTAVPTIDRSTIKAIATERIGRLAFREIFPGKYRKAEIRAAQEAATMLASGDKTGAAAAKMRQVMNYYLGMEASKAKADTMKIVDRMGRYNKKKVRTEILKAEGGYLDQIDNILNRFEFRKAASLKSVESINLWVKDRTENHGDGLIISNGVLDESYITHWKNVPFNELQGINDSVKNIEHVARYSNKIALQQEEVDFKKLMTEWVDSIEQNEERFERKDKASRMADVRQATALTTARRWASQLTKIPFLASWLDGGERVGLSHDILIQPMTDALDAKMRLVREIAEPVMQSILNRSRADMKRHNTKIFIPEINDTLEGHQVLAVALNTGNAGNLKKLLLGESWANPEIEADISFDNPKLQAVLQHMTKSDWLLVQSIWDQMELLYPQLAEVHRKTTGLTPPKVVATPIENEFGTFKGGYYPVKYSPARSHKAEKNAEKLQAETESMFNNTASIQASVNTGSTNERTGFYDRIYLSLEVVPDHFNETIHYITHHDAVRQTNKMIQQPQVANAITGVLGADEFKLLKPWLNDIAKDGRQQPTKTFIDESFQKLRMGTTLGVMGFKASTGIMQFFGLFTTAAELGVGPTTKAIYDTIGKSWYMKAVRKTLGNRNDLQSNWDFALERSKVMPHRTETMDREIRNAMKQLQGKEGILAAVQETSMKHIALIQTYMVDLPTWIAAYDKTISETGDETKAIQYGDWAVENLQGSGATKDMSAILRNQSKIATTYTMFMTFFSSLGGLSRDVVKGARSGLYSPTSVAAKLMFLYAIPVFAEMLMRGEFAEPDDDDDRLSKYTTAVALYPVQSIPFARDVASGLFSDYGYNSSPVASVIEKGIMGVKQVGERSFTDKEVTKSQIKNITKLAGASLGVPGVNQMWSTGEHLYEVIEEGEDLTLRELLFGPERNK